ncbi:MAG: hypothetical protein ACLS3Y_07060 [Collinsella sp.]
MSSVATPSPSASRTWAPSAGTLRRPASRTDVDESEEINACTVKVKVDVDGEDQDWLFCLRTRQPPDRDRAFRRCRHLRGGAIRDPLGPQLRTRPCVTGAGDPTVPVSETSRASCRARS